MKKVSFIYFIIAFWGLCSCSNSDNHEDTNFVNARFRTEEKSHSENGYINILPGETVTIYAFAGHGMNKYYGSAAKWKVLNTSVANIGRTGRAAENEDVYFLSNVTGNSGVIDDTTTLTLQLSYGNMHKELSIPVHVSLLARYPEKTFLQDVNSGMARFAMYYIKGGVFTMGSSSEESGLTLLDKEYVHDDQSHFVQLTDYFVAETEVTQNLWTQVMGNDYEIIFDETNEPVHDVTWTQCQDFIQALNNLTGYHYRLLTEAEWEYAARGGENSRHFVFAGSSDIDEVAWYYNNSFIGEAPFGKRWFHEVAQLNPNEFGIYDMSGNVSEWCSDSYDKNTYISDNEKGIVIDPKGSENGTNRVIRGGNYLTPNYNCRISKRFYGDYQSSDITIGLRLAMSYSDYLEMLKTKNNIYAETHQFNK